MQIVLMVCIGVLLQQTLYADIPSTPVSTTPAPASSVSTTPASVASEATASSAATTPATMPSAAVSPAAPAASASPGAAGGAAAAPATVAEQSVLTQIADLNKRVEAVSGLTPQSEKDKILGQVRDIIAGMATMVANDLDQTKLLLEKIAANPSMLASNQKAAFAQWQASVKRARKLIDEPLTLLVSIKNTCTPPENAPTDWVTALAEKKFKGVVHAVYFAINFLTTATLDAAEKDQAIAQSLAGRVAAILPLLFNARGGKKAKAATALYRTMYVANKQGFEKIISPVQVRMARCCMLLSQAAEAKVVLDGLKNAQDASVLIEQAGYEHEKHLLINYFETVFANRAKHAAVELASFASLVQTVTDKDILPAADDAIWTARIPSVKACAALAQDYTTLDTALTAYKNLLPTIAQPEAQAERSLLATILGKLFGQRGTFAVDQRKTLTAFFEQIKATDGVLADNQLAVFDLWLSALREGK